MRTGVGKLISAIGSVVAAQRAATVVIGRVARRIGVARRIAVSIAAPITIAAAIATAIAIARAIVGTAITGASLIARLRRPVARTGIGRPLIDMIVLLQRIGQPFGGPAAAAVAAAIVGVAVAEHRRGIDRCRTRTDIGRTG